MRFLIILILVTSFSCKSQEKYTSNESNASIEVLNQINYIEKQYYERYLKDKPYSFNLVNGIVNLSGITPKEWTGNWIGLAYTPNEKDISKWKKWYNENKGNFYFNDKHRVVKFYNSKEIDLDKKLIFLKTNTGETRSTFSSNDFLSTYRALYKYQNLDLKNSKDPSDKILYHIMSLKEKDTLPHKTLKKLEKLSKLKISDDKVSAYELIGWFTKYEDYIYYEDNKIAIKYPNGEKIVF